MAREYTGRRGEKIANPKKCKASVSNGGKWGWLHPHQCKRKPWKDGWCKQHHPDTESKKLQESQERREASHRLWLEKQDRGKWIERLPALVAKLHKCVQLGCGDQFTEQEQKDIDRCSKETE